MIGLVCKTVLQDGVIVIFLLFWYEICLSFDTVVCGRCFFV